MKHTHFLEVFNGVCNKDKRAENEFFEILMKIAKCTFKKFREKNNSLHWCHVEDAVMIKINSFFNYDFSNHPNPMGLVSTSFKNTFIDVSRGNLRDTEDCFSTFISDDYTEEALVEEISNNFYEIENIGEELKNTRLEIIKKGIEKLPFKQKHVLKLLANKFTYKQVAVLLNCSVQCVYNNKLLAIKNLKKWVSAYMKNNKVGF
jgi:DNA-directed RNA polymerase specialized sigma24 family protein